MTVVDPLVSLHTSDETGLRGWAVAAALVSQLQEADRSGALDVSGILAAAISDLDEAELKELDRQLFGPLTENSRRGEWNQACLFLSRSFEG